MIFVEDLKFGEEMYCGELHFDRQRMIQFAHEFDPQPFHLIDSAAEGTLFEGLSASGLYVSVASLACALRGKFRDMSYLGSPGAQELRMYRPVYAGTTLRVFQTFMAVEMPDERPGVGYVTGFRRAVGDDGSLVMACTDVSWFASRHVSDSLDLGELAASRESVSGLMALLPLGLKDGESKIPEPGKRLWFDDFRVGDIFISDWLTVREPVLDWFHASFDGRPSEESTLVRPWQNLTNRWINPALIARQLVDTVWNRSEMAGGGSLLGLRWGSDLRAGDALRLQATVAEVRALKSRNDIGLVNIDAVCANQHDEVVGQLQVIAFIRMRRGVCSPIK